MISEILVLLCVEILLVGGMLSVVVLGLVLNRTLQRNRRYGIPDSAAPLAPVVDLASRHTSDPALASRRSWVR
jgi:hypothetical protein